MKSWKFNRISILEQDSSRVSLPRGNWKYTLCLIFRVFGCVLSSFKGSLQGDGLNFLKGVFCSQEWLGYVKFLRAMLRNYLKPMTAKAKCSVSRLAKLADSNVSLFVFLMVLWRETSGQEAIFKALFLGGVGYIRGGRSTSHEFFLAHVLQRRKKRSKIWRMDTTNECWFDRPDHCYRV